MPFYLRENVTRDKPSANGVDPRARELLAELNSLDIELYVFARKLFESRCAEYGASLARDLAHFQTWNARYQQVVGPVTDARRRLARLRSGRAF
jgi:hypothetical protein